MGKKESERSIGSAGKVLGGLVDTVTLGATDLSGQKKEQKRQQRKIEEELKKSNETAAKKQEEEKKKQKQSTVQMFESLRQGSLGLLKSKDKQVIG